MSAGAPPLIWSVAGHDSAGGAGLSADQRAADACGVHLCPVVAAVTAQHSGGVEAVFPLSAAQIEAQFNALEADLPPAAIKCGLLGSVAAVQAVARRVDRLRAAHPGRPLPLVIDPVRGASAGGVAFANADLRAALCAELLPRATLITPNRAEAAWLLGQPGAAGPRHAAPGPDLTSVVDVTAPPAPPALAALPDLAAALQALGAANVVITGGDGPEDWALDWLQATQASGWLAGPRLPTPHHHGTGCSFATGAAAALAWGHGAADAVVLAKMLTAHALRHGHAAGRGRGPVQARPGFAAGPAQGGTPLPLLGLGRSLPRALGAALAPATEAATEAAAEPATEVATQAAPEPGAEAPAKATTAPFAAFTPPPDGLYAIVDDAARVEEAAARGLRCIQLRRKRPAGQDDAAWAADLRQQLVTAAAACEAHGALFIVNDHWREALNTLHVGGHAHPHKHPHPHPYPHLRLGLHLGQEDLLALRAEDHALLQQAARQRAASGHGLVLGLSSHSLWELARAAAVGPSYIACGPVQATLTKDMPWLPQGTHNLAWWVANSPAPVVAIGGLLSPEDAAAAAACGPAAVCVVRGLGQDAAGMQAALPPLREALARAQAQASIAPPRLPHPVLPAGPACAAACPPR